MPELPEVEVTRRAIVQALRGHKLSGVIVRAPALRYPLPTGLERLLAGRTLLDVGRRGKYLLLNFGTGTLLVHLGMSGSLRLYAPATEARRHDHLDLVFGATALRLRDPRRFGAVLWLKADPAQHPLLASLGVEPLSDDFTASRLHLSTRGRRAPIKQALMDSRLVVGIGNIYASESLFRAGIDPRAAAGSISRRRYERLAAAIRATLEAAIAAGGSSLRDFVGSDGTLGHFQQQFFVYGREGLPCRVCGRPIESLRQAGRATFHCPGCQR